MDHQVTAAEKGEDLEGGAKAGLAKRRLLDDVVVSVNPVAKRQRAWMSRESQAKPASWRPTRHYRLGAKWWLLALDNQVRQSTRFEGLSSFVRQESWDEASWAAWPGFQLAGDLGSDGVAAWHCMVYHWRMNALLVPDESHSAKNAFTQMLKAVGLQSLVLLMVISWNLEFGPRQEETRRSDLRIALAACYENRTPSECPLFLQLLDAITSELETFGEHRFPRTAPIEEEVWTFLRDRNRFGTLGRRCCLARYGAALDSAQKHRAYAPIGQRSFGNAHSWPWNETSWGAGRSRR